MSHCLVQVQISTNYPGTTRPRMVSESSASNADLGPLPTSNMDFLRKVPIPFKQLIISGKNLLDA